MLPMDSHAADSNVLTMQQAIDTAIQNNLELKAAHARLGVSDAAIRSAGAVPNPNFMSDSGIAEKTYRWGIEQTLELGGKRKNRISVARAQRDVDETEITRILLRLRIDVRRAYTQLYYSQEEQKTYQDLVDSSQKLLEVAQKREKAGDVSNLDTLQAEMLALTDKNSLQSLQIKTVQAQNVLNSLMNLPLSQSRTLETPNPFHEESALVTPPPEALPLHGSLQKSEEISYQYSLDRLIDLALNRRPEMQQNRRNKTLASRQLSLAKVSRIPDLSVMAGPDLVTGEGGFLSAFITVLMEIPVWDRQQGPIAEAMAQQVFLSQEDANLKNLVTLEVTNAYNAMQANQARVLRYETELIPKSREIVEKSRRSFEAGKTSILIPINANEAYATVRLGYLDALNDYQSAISDLERATGVGL